MTPLPRVTFGMIVLNGEPFVRYNLRALYPFAHEIIVVEGAVESAAAIATHDGHSLDGTLETLHRFQAEEDPDNKLTIITCDGFWSEKDAMSQAYAEQATGDYLWQIDADEFYYAEDMRNLLQYLHAHPTVSAVSFPMLTFWGGFDVLCDGYYLRDGAAVYHRLFRWGDGYHYVTHRPPTVHDEQGRDLRNLHWLEATAAACLGIYLYHYSLVFPHQVTGKSAYYSRAGWSPLTEADHWAQDTFFGLKRPYRVHNVYQYPSWLMRFNGQHPQQINALRADLTASRLDVETRPTADVEQLLRSPRYKLGRLILQVGYHLRPVGRFLRRARASLRYRGGLLLNRLRREPSK